MHKYAFSCLRPTCDQPASHMSCCRCLTSMHSRDYERFATSLRPKYISALQTRDKPLSPARVLQNPNSCPRQCHTKWNPTHVFCSATQTHPPQCHFSTRIHPAKPNTESLTLSLSLSLALSGHVKIIGACVPMARVSFSLDTWSWIRQGCCARDASACS